jgi:phage gpG-like protein
VFTIEVIGREELKARFSGAGANVRDALRRAIQASVIDMEAQVKEKLSGPVLRNRTGRLRNSVTSRVDIGLAGNQIVGTVGANTPYAAVHEYGFQGVVSVREHLRMITQAFGKPLKGGPREITIHAHPMKMDMPERSYLRSTLRENGQRIHDRLQDAVNQAVAQDRYSGVFSE